MESPSLEVFRMQLVTEPAWDLVGLKGLQRCVPTSADSGIMRNNMFLLRTELSLSLSGAVQCNWQWEPKEVERTWTGACLCSRGAIGWIPGEALAVESAVTWALPLPSDGRGPFSFLQMDPCQLLSCQLSYLLSSWLFCSPPFYPPILASICQFSVAQSFHRQLSPCHFPQAFLQARADTRLPRINPLWSDGQHGYQKGTLTEDHTAFSNWKFFHIQLKLLELLRINIVGILSRSGGRRPSGVILFPYPCSWKSPSWLGWKPEEDFSLAARLETVSQVVKVCQCYKEWN